MAVYFELVVCAGASEASADALLEHFEASCGALLHPGMSVKTAREDPREQNAAEAWRTAFVPRGIGYGVPADRGCFIEADEERLAVLTELHDALRTAPPFVAAFCGYEIREALRDRDAPDEIIRMDGVWLDAVALTWPGTVIPEAWAEKLLSPPERARLEPFTPGRLWRPGLDRLLRPGGSS